MPNGAVGQWRCATATQWRKDSDRVLQHLRVQQGGEGTWQDGKMGTGTTTPNSMVMGSCNADSYSKATMVKAHDRATVMAVGAVAQ